MVKFLFIVISLWMPFMQDDLLKDIGIAVKAASVKELIQFCNSTIEIKIDGVSTNYSKSQAEVILRDFFSNHPPTDFSYVHQGASPEGLKYTIGKYSHKNGAFRVVMLIKKIDNKYLIDTLNFSKE